MKLWADVYNAAGARLGGGPVLLQSASVTRVLDGIGSVSVTAPGTDARARALLTNENHIRIYFQPTDSAAIRELGRGVIRQVRASGSPSQWSLEADGPDALDALGRVSTKLGRTYSQQATGTIASSLVGLVTGWTASTTGGEVTDARFDGLSVFKALAGLAEAQGLHLRAGASANTVELGAFGTAAGLRLVNPTGTAPGMENADELALIETIQVHQDSEAVCNRLYAIGAGIGEAWLTLENSTRTTPYTVQSASHNGITHYYLEDAASVALYGVIEKVGKFQVAPLTNSAVDLENGANGLYDIAAAWLTRNSQRVDALTVTARKVRTTVKPGDTVRVVYNGVVTRDGVVVNYLDVDDDYWVMEATERVGLEGAALDLTLASVDRHPADGARVVIGALEELRIDGVTVKPYFNLRSYVYDRLIDPFHPATVPVRISNATQRLSRCLVTFKSASFTSTVQPTTAQTNHRHSVVQSNASYSGPYHLRNVVMYDQASDSNFNLLLPVSIETDAFLAQTGIETVSDFISLSYGLQSDTQRPTSMSLWVNGVDRTAALGGPWATGGAAVTVTVDITSYIEAESVFQKEHVVEVKCVSGQGEIETTVELFEIIQAIRVV